MVELLRPEHPGQGLSLHPPGILGGVRRGDLRVDDAAIIGWSGASVCVHCYEAARSQRAEHPAADLAAVLAEVADTDPTAQPAPPGYPY